MEKACTLCYSLVLHHKPHSALKKISELKGSELYKCCCCYAYLHKHDNEWEIISGGDFSGKPADQVAVESQNQTSEYENENQSFAKRISYQP
ncbi:hypothetical protein ACMXYN_07330 [Neptuniibacter sp. PT8_73]|uniref:hypothetical protein n=1 Tax=unclassified Neptuniibacter TaxID=2630693 RepID=UPI0039F4AA2B